MTEERAQRRLAAILAVDVVGFSRLMEVDEVGTLAALKWRRRNLLDPLVARYDGRIFKVVGDGVLAAFGSAVNAVQCAVDLQQAMADANKDLPDEGRIVLRVGINLGDVIADGSDLYGDGVNIAARLESIAEAGGIVVSGTTFDHIKTKIKVSFEDLGPQHLKNIAEAVRAYRVVGTSIATARPSRDNRPSVAVLAFDNMSGDEQQEYLGHGLAEDIITDLSKISTLSVIARNTTFALKGKSIEAGQLARQLNVTHIVEGSVRTFGDRIRINVQLIDARAGDHLWAERYDRQLRDVFAVQDEISHAIVDALKVRLAQAERAGIGQRTTDNVEAYQLYLMGRFYMRSQARHSTRMAADLFRRATELDPKFARGWASLALAHSWLKARGGTETSFEDIEAFIDTALQLDDTLAEVHAARAELLLRHLDVKAAEAVARRAIALDPTLHYAHFTLGEALRRTGRFADAARAYEVSIPLNDHAWWAAVDAAWCYEQIGDTDSALRLNRIALKKLEDAIAFDPQNAEAYSMGSFVLWQLGQQNRAREWADRALELGHDSYLAQYNCACFLILSGDEERAFDVLDHCTPRFSREQFNWMRIDPDLDPVRSHPRYLALINREEKRWNTPAG